MTRIAFYAPLKPPDHPTPSGDREIARLTLLALEDAGFAPFVASRLRVYDGAGSAETQAALQAAAAAKVARIVADPDPPRLWFTYHSYYKAPDLIGPQVAQALAIRYVVSEASHAPRRRAGPWAAFAALNEVALQAADRVFWTTPRDLPGLGALLPADRLTGLPAFLDPGPAPQPRRTGTPPRLLTVAMMRAGDKFASYRALAAACAHLPAAWPLTIVGDGPMRAEVAALFPQARFPGLVADRAALRRVYEAHDLLLWPGIGEGFGMVYLEAQAAGLPALAENHPGPAAVLAPGPALPAPGDAAGFAAAARALLADDTAGPRARAHILARHSLAAAAHRLRDHLLPLLR